MEDLDWARWRAATPAERERLVAEAAKQVDGQPARLASGPCVRRGERHFALVPGGPVTLGWDGAPLGLTAAQRHDWREASDEPSFEAFLRPFCGPRAG